MKKNSLFYLKVGIILGLLATAWPARGAMTLRLSGNLPTGDTAIKALDAVAQRIAVETEGAIRIMIHPSSQVLTPRDRFDAIAEGAMDMAFVGLDGRDGKVPLFRILTLPYAFPSLDAVMKSCRGELGDALDKEAQKAGVKIVSVGFVEYAHCFTKKKLLLNPSDYRGVRIAVCSENMGEGIKLLGGIPVKVPVSQMYSALERDVVDGHMGTVTDATQKKFYVWEKYGVISPLGIRPIHVIANLKTWNTISPAHQSIITHVFHEMADDLVKTTRKVTLETGLTRLRMNGMKIHVQCAEEMDPFRYVMEPLYDQFRKETGDKGRQALNMIALNPFARNQIP